MDSRQQVTRRRRLPVAHGDKYHAALACRRPNELALPLRSDPLCTDRLAPPKTSTCAADGTGCSSRGRQAIGTLKNWALGDGGKASISQRCPMERHTEAKSFHSTAVLKNIATPPHPVPCLKASEVKGKPKRDRKMQRRPPLHLASSTFRPTAIFQ